MTETRTWPRVALAVAILLTGTLLIACQRSAPSQTVSPAAAAPPATPPTASVDLVQLASTALQDCPESTAPPTIPDGTKASTAQMAAAHAAFQAYDAATNNYTRCVDATVERIAAQYKATASAADIESLQTFGGKAHNTAIDQEQAVADQFNTQLRAFKARHPRA